MARLHLDFQWHTWIIVCENSCFSRFHEQDLLANEKVYKVDEGEGETNADCAILVDERDSDKVDISVRNIDVVVIGVGSI